VCECVAAKLYGLDVINFRRFTVTASDRQESGAGLPGDINGGEVVDFNDMETLAYHWLSDCSEE